MKRISIKWALDQSTGNPVFIENARNGLACNCRCAECGKIMIAEQGETKKRAWNFRHQEASECAGGFETAIHKAAKEIIISAAEIMISGGKISYTNARAEYILGDFRSDVSVTSAEFDVHFEIEVTNPVNQAKSNFYKVNKHKSIKIDLSSVPREITLEELKELILNSTKGKQVIYWTDEQQKVNNSGSGFFWLILVLLAIFGLGSSSKKGR